MLEPNTLIYIPYPRVNCLKTIPFTAAHTYIAYIWQCPPRDFSLRPKKRHLLRRLGVNDRVEILLLGHYGYKIDGFPSHLYFLPL